MTIAHDQRWRIFLVLAGLATAFGGSRHPEGDAKDSLTGELATMTSGDTWVLSHTFLAIGTALLATGLWSAYRNRSWPNSTRRALHVAAITMSLYVVETLFHLASAIDSDALADGDVAPIAFTHVGLALVLYPVSGLTFAWMNTRVFRAATLPMKTFGVVGVVAGLLHAASVPMTIVLPDTELSPVFASAGMLLAIWSLGMGIGGMRGAMRPTTSTSSSRPSTLPEPSLG